MLGLKKIIMAFLLLWMLCAVVACNLSGPEAGWTLVGTWINAEYEGPDGIPAKVVYRADGSAEIYELISATTADGTGTYVIEADWTENGIHWFKVKYFFGANPGYELDRLTNDGNTYESYFVSGGYPASIDPTSPNYRIRYRQ